MTIRRRPPGYHAMRKRVCAEHGVKNTGRQWRNLRKWLRLRAKAARA